MCHTIRGHCLYLRASYAVWNKYCLYCVKRRLFVCSCVSLSVCLSVSPSKNDKLLSRNWHNLIQIRVMMNPWSDRVDIGNIWPWPLTCDSYVSDLDGCISIWHPCERERDIDSPRSSCCEGEFISLRQRVSSRCSTHETMLWKLQVMDARGFIFL